MINQVIDPKLFNEIQIDDDSGKWSKYGAFEISDIVNSQYSDDRQHYVLTVNRSHG